MKRLSVGVMDAALLIALAALVFRFCSDRRGSASGRVTKTHVVAINKLFAVRPCLKVSERELNVAATDSQSTKPMGTERSEDAGAEAEQGDVTAGSFRSSNRAFRAVSPRQRKERQIIQRFDALTDKWSRHQKTPATVEEVKAFVTAFQGLPPSRRLEHLQRSLNLIPDENVILLAGVLLDEGTDEVSAKAIFEDIINRNESVKKPILEEIYKDKSHSCWDDTRWIFEVTGETPKEI